MASSPAEPPGFRRGPDVQIRLLERSLRQHRLLADDDHMIEWRQGRLIRLRINGADQPVFGLRVAERVGLSAGMSSLSYSDRALFCIGRRMRAADLGRVHRLEAIGGRSLCAIYSAAPGRLVSYQWRTGEPGEQDAEVAGLVSRITEQRDRRLSDLSPQARDQVGRERAELVASGMIDTEFLAISAPPDQARRS